MRKDINGTHESRRIITQLSNMAHIHSYSILYKKLYYSLDSDASLDHYNDNI